MSPERLVWGLGPSTVPGWGRQVQLNTDLVDEVHLGPHVDAHAHDSADSSIHTCKSNGYSSDNQPRAITLPVTWVPCHLSEGSSGEEQA